MRIDLSKLAASKPSMPDAEGRLVFTQGVGLIWGVLIALVILSLILIVTYIVQESRLSDFILTNSKEILKEGVSVSGMQQLIDNREKAIRDGILQMGQMILVGIFFPVLTALLGHLFGSRKG